jgi:hypothetical protein
MPDPKPSEADVALMEAQQMLALWLSIKSSLQKALAEEEVRPNDEMYFLDAKAELTKVLRGVLVKLPPGVSLSQNQVGDIMRQATSIANLRSTPKSDRIALIAQWHSVFVTMCRAVGAFQFIKEGYVPPTPVDPKGKGKAKTPVKAGPPPKRH